MRYVISIFIESIDMKRAQFQELQKIKSIYRFL